MATLIIFISKNSFGHKSIYRTLSPLTNCNPWQYVFETGYEKNLILYIVYTNHFDLQDYF